MKSADTNFGNDHIFDMTNFDESGRRMEWSKNEFSHSRALEPTATAPSAFTSLPPASDSGATSQFLIGLVADLHFVIVVNLARSDESGGPSS